MILVLRASTSVTKDPIVILSAVAAAMVLCNLGFTTVLWNVRAKVGMGTENTDLKE